jgi:enterochelin esterase-like enzyme
MSAQMITNPVPTFPTGNLQCLNMHSDFLSGDRCIWIYTPYKFAATASRFPVLMLYYGEHYLQNTPIRTVLDSLIAAGLITPIVAVFIGQVKAHHSQELSYNRPLIQHLTREVIPWVQLAYNTSDDPQQTIIGGECVGGTMAIHTALRHPDLIGNVLCQSAAFHCSPYSKSNSQWLVGLFADNKRLPLRICLDVDIHRNAHLPIWNANMVKTNRQMRDVLRARGYPICYTEYSGSRDTLNWRDTLSDSLVRLLGSKNNVAGTYWRAIEINSHHFIASMPATASPVA